VRDTATLGPGTGLGLSVVKSLVEAHGGSVHADAAPGTGTRMTVMLPALP
jgi:signal transduction histidine kinase